MNICKGWKTFLIGAALALASLVTGRAYAVSSATLNIDITVNASAAVSIDSLGVSTSPGTGANGVAWSAATRLYASGDNEDGITFDSATVTNPGNLTEHWYLSTTNSIDASGGGGATWSVLPTTNTADISADAFAVQAVFASSATTGGSIHTVTGGTTNCPQSGAAGNNTNSAIWNSTATVVYPTSTNPLTTGDTGNAYGSKGSALGGALFTNFVYNGPAGNGCPDTGCLTNKYQMLSNSASPTGSGTRALCWRVILPTSTSATTNQIIPLIVTAQQL